MPVDVDQGMMPTWQSERRQLIDGNFFHFVADFNLSYGVHTLGYLAKNGVTTVEMGDGIKRNVKLTVSRVGIRSSCHGDRPGHMFVRIELRGNILAGPSGTVAQRV